MDARGLIIAIDGPSGAGKGTVARALAERFQCRHVDTGAMYRAVAWKARHDRIDLTDAAAVSALAQAADCALGDRILIDGHDVTEAIRTPEIDEAAAIVARHADVRRVLVDRQRAFGRAGGVVMEGRDIGTVVFPDADVKVYLDAAPEERARRRAGDAAHAVGRAAADVAGVARSLEARDTLDRSRAVSPLAVAPDAIYLDTTRMAIADVVAHVAAAIERKVTERAAG